MKNATQLILLLLFGLCLGCAEQKSPPVQNQQQDAPQDDAKQPVAKPKPVSPDKPVQAEQAAPDAAVRAVIEQLQNNQLTGLWEFLPASYQRDVNQLVHDWADQIEPERWKQVFGIMQNGLKLLQTKKAIILEHQRELKTLTEEQYDEMVALLENLLQGELANREAVKQLDVGAFLKKSGGEFLQRLSKLSEQSPDNPWLNARRQWDDLQIEVIESDENNALLQLSLGDDPDSQQRVPFILVEGKWIPLVLAGNWNSFLNNLRAQFRSESGESPQTTQKLEANLTTLFNEFNQHLIQLQSAESADEFSKLLQQNQQEIAALLSERQQLLADQNAEPQTASSEQKSVTIVVLQELDAKAARKLIDELLPLADDPNLALATVQRDRNQTRITLSPVNNFPRFTKRITFTKVTETNADKSTMTLVWPPVTTETPPP